MDKPKVCADCLHAYKLPASQKYRRCDKSVAKPGSDATLAGSMRATLPEDGGCGPDATLFEARVSDGQA